MCRAGERHCAPRTEMHRERYNAQRRVSRNRERGRAAETAGDATKAEVYANLVASAEEQVRALDLAIEEHDQRALAEANARDEEVGGLHRDSVQDADFYRMGHRAPHDDSDSDDPYYRHLGGDLEESFPDVYDHPDYYDGSDEETMAQLRAVRRNPDAPVTVYRAVPNGITAINKGDWVTLSREYAEGHAYDLEGSGRDGVVIEAQVPANQVWTDGNSLAEFGYDGSSHIDTSAAPPARGGVGSSGNGLGGPERCSGCGQFAGGNHDCPQTLADSVARDDSGSLLVVHHGSQVEFDTFDPTFTGGGNDTWGSGFYFTRDFDSARAYGEHVKSVMLDLKNPIRVNGSDVAHLDAVMVFNAEQSEAILRRHPAIYAQPGDDPSNPLEDYAEQFWDKDSWSRAELDQMLRDVSRQYLDDVPWSNLEGMFPRESSGAFRDAVQEVTGHDGVVVTFANGDQHWIAWTPGQVHDASGGAERCPDCGQFMGPGHSCSQRGDSPSPDQQATSATSSDEVAASAFGATTTPEPVAINADGSEMHSLAIAPAEPVDFAFVRNPISSTTHLPKGDNTYGQKTEPAGRYMSESSGFTPEGWQSGTVRFEKPLHIEFGGGYAEESNWKNRLSAHYGGKTGKALSQALRNDGYDAIITRDKYGTSETIDLTSYKPKATRSSTRTARSSEPGGWDTSTTHSPKEAFEFGKSLEAKYGEGVEVFLGGGKDPDSFVTMHKVFIPKEQRGKGLGKKIMADFVAEADRNGWRTSLSPDGEWGSSVTRLKKFYGEFGFVANSGRNKSYETRETMVRMPNKD